MEGKMKGILCLLGKHKWKWYKRKGKADYVTASYIVFPMNQWRRCVRKGCTAKENLGVVKDSV